MFLALDEKTFIIENHKIFNSYTIFRRKFCKQFNKKTAPTRKTYTNIINKFKSIGSVENRTKSGRPRSVSTDPKIDEICNLMKNVDRTYFCCS